MPTASMEGRERNETGVLTLHGEAFLLLTAESVAARTCAKSEGQVMPVIKRRRFDFADDLEHQLERRHPLLDGGLVPDDHLRRHVRGENTAQ